MLTTTTTNDVRTSAVGPDPKFSRLDYSLAVAPRSLLAGRWALLGSLACGGGGGGGRRPALADAQVALQMLLVGRISQWWSREARPTGSAAASERREKQPGGGAFALEELGCDEVRMLDAGLFEGCLGCVGAWVLGAVLGCLGCSRVLGGNCLGGVGVASTDEDFHFGDGAWNYAPPKRAEKLEDEIPFG